jgi:hypothetical protein
VLRSSGMDDLNDLERGIVVGLLIGEGHFGFDGRRPQIVMSRYSKPEWTHVLERMERMKTLSRRYLAEVWEREAGVAHYRPPRQKLTPAW